MTCPSETKTCVKCGEEKLPSAFAFDKRRGKPNTVQCRSCCNARTKTLRTRARTDDPVEWWARNMPAFIKHRADKAGIPFDLVYADLLPLAVASCPILNIPLDYGIKGGRSGPRDNSPSVDRAVPVIGYVRGNISVIANKANRLKGDGTAAEHRRIADWMDRQIHGAT